MTVAEQLIQQIEGAGGRLSIDGTRLRVEPSRAGAPRPAAEVIEKLKANKRAVIDLLLARDAELWRGAFEGWLSTRCIQRQRDFGSFNVLLIDLNLQAGLQGGSACGPGLFSWLLAGRDFLTAEVCGTMLVSGLLLKEDWQAHQRFQEAVSDET
jgi:hypothetical protein